MESYELTSPRAMYAERAQRILRYPLALSKLQKLSFSESELRDNVSRPERSEIAIIGGRPNLSEIATRVEEKIVRSRWVGRAARSIAATALEGGWAATGVLAACVLRAPLSLARIRFLLIVYATGALEAFLIKTTYAVFPQLRG